VKVYSIAFVAASLGLLPVHLHAEAITGPQKNAQRSAIAYLNISGFSRAGLIDQLSSPYGDQYRVQDATIAVDRLDVDWNAQAARSAAQYPQMMGFPCAGLIDQPSSSYGPKYTRAQAEFGERQAGPC